MEPGDYIVHDWKTGEARTFSIRDTMLFTLPRHYGEEPVIAIDDGNRHFLCVCREPAYEVQAIYAQARFDMLRD